MKSKYRYTTNYTHKIAAKFTYNNVWHGLIFYGCGWWNGIIASGYSFGFYFLKKKLFRFDICKEKNIRELNGIQYTTDEIQFIYILHNYEKQTKLTTDKKTRINSTLNKYDCVCWRLQSLHYRFVLTGCSNFFLHFIEFGQFMARAQRRIDRKRFVEFRIVNVVALAFIVIADNG